VSQRIRRPILAAAVLPLVVIVGFQSAWAAFACGVDGKVRDHCCCKAGREDRSPVEPVPRIDAKGCCEASFHEVTSAPLAREVERAVFGHLARAVPVTAIVVVPDAERPRTIATLARPPPPRVALYLDKHALLR
jgi:hypothetical protein